MLFNSITFFIFLIITFIVYWKSVSYSQRMSKLVLLVSSYIFYGWWDWRFLILILISSTTDFIIGNLLFKTKEQQKQKSLLILSIFINIGILALFKYFNFFIDSFKSLTGIITDENHWSTLNIILPVGISFYTFQTLSYTIDIYKRKIEPTKSALTFFTFVAFFPQLVAGPIERAKRLIPQFEKKPKFSFSQASSGLKLILWGLFKKMVIADQLSIIVDTVYTNPENFNGAGIILATLFFGFQIYCDFSGYSDIAIGTARLFGIELMINFRTPYFATSIRDFWHRWHISLSTWFRDYIYISLGGNQTNSIKWARNILITFVISGLWHGANITFIIWGFIHGLLFILERFISPFIKIPNKLKNVAGLIITFSIVNFSWLFFRAESWNQVKILFKHILNDKTINPNSFIQLIQNSGHLTEPGRMLLFVFPFFILVEYFIGNKTFDHILNNSPKLIRWSFYYLIILSILFFGVLNSAPQFIYFQF
ncbi:MAG: MBOAT family protein [Bacteroidetes bacterium]|nr:MBOAT family protein [Bacteroidota bacterium]